MLQIRKIKPEDIDFLLEMTAESRHNGGKLLSNFESFLICENDNVKCGCGCMVQSGEKGFMAWVTVGEGYRRKKLGGAITKALLNIADHKGVKEVYAAGICDEFLKALGFEETDASTATDGIKEVLGYAEDQKCYKVSLMDYFKPCSQNQQS